MPLKAFIRMTEALYKTKSRKSYINILYYNRSWNVKSPSKIVTTAYFMTLHWSRIISGDSTID